jgi:hypothetical protein
MSMNIFGRACIPGSRSESEAARDTPAGELSQAAGAASNSGDPQKKTASSE